MSEVVERIKPYTERLSEFEKLTLLQAYQIRQEMLGIVKNGVLSVDSLALQHEVTPGVINCFIQKHDWQVCHHRLYNVLKPAIQQHTEIRLDLEKITVKRIGLKFGSKTNTWRVIQKLTPKFEGASAEDKARARQCAIETFKLKTVKS